MLPKEAEDIGSRWTGEVAESKEGGEGAVFDGATAEVVGLVFVRPWQRVSGISDWSLPCWLTENVLLLEGSRTTSFQMRLTFCSN